tara:strand:+ start:1439 stop:2395 length:957 start_codon:yes stop_codon:yes gene_type:complete
MCFEDAIHFEELKKAEINVFGQVDQLSLALEKQEITIDEIPLIFLRVRNVEQFINFTKRLTPKQAGILTGFVFPKFHSDNACTYLTELRTLNGALGVHLYGMPILEGKEIAYCESRTKELLTLRQILSQYRDIILNIRVGGTDFSSLFGVRRNINFSVYDILPVSDALSDIINFFNRVEEDYVISGPVWEYFLANSDRDIDKLNQQKIYQAIMKKEPIINEAIDGLLREIMLDKTNGFVGKTVIHPSHLKYVNAMQAVTLEEYEDACQILESTGGVCKSNNSNKMNEINPHRGWAKRLVERGKAYGVIESENEYIQFY